MSSSSDTKVRRSRPSAKIVKEPNSPDSTVDDLDILHQSLKGQQSEDFLYTSGDDTEEITQFHRTVQTLFEEEENLLNLHMGVIQVSLTNHVISML